MASFELLWKHFSFGDCNNQDDGVALSGNAVRGDPTNGPIYGSRWDCLGCIDCDRDPMIP